MEILKNLEHHRCRTRIREFGEVFTPESFVYDLLNQLGNKNAKIWSDESVTFYEPSCGHGNFCDAILEKRLEAFYKKAVKRKHNKPSLYAVANSINNLWAIDIDRQNIEITRQRLLYRCLEFIKSKTDYSGNFAKKFVSNNLTFFAHLVAALKWQIHENEALSSLATEDEARKTKSGTKWLDRNKHKKIDFDLTWIEYFRELSQHNVQVLEFETLKKQIKRDSYTSIEFVKHAIEHLNEEVRAA